MASKGQNIVCTHSKIVTLVMGKQSAILRLVRRKQGRRCRRKVWLQTVDRGGLDMDLGRSC